MKSKNVVTQIKQKDNITKNEEAVIVDKLISRTYLKGQGDDICEYQTFILTGKVIRKQLTIKILQQNAHCLEKDFLLEAKPFGSWKGAACYPFKCHFASASNHRFKWHNHYYQG